MKVLSRIILGSMLLTACATPTAVHHNYCPPLVDYTKEEQSALSAENRGPMTEVFLRDYLELRDFIRGACK